MLIERWFDAKTFAIVDGPGPDARSTIKIVLHDSEANGTRTAAARCEVHVHVSASGETARDALRKLGAEYDDQSGKTAHALLPKIAWSRIVDGFADAEGV